MVEHHGDGQDRGGRVRDLAARDVGGGAVDGLEHAREGAVGVDVGRCGEADAATDRASEVGEDVAEEVVGDDRVEACRVGDEEDRRGVDVQVVDDDVGELDADRAHRALPEPAGVHEHVRLVDEGEAAATGGRGLEREPHDPLHAEGGVDAHLVGDLVGSTPTDDPAVADVGALGALAHHDEVDVTGGGERRDDSGQDRRRSQVHVVVECEPQPQEQPTLDDPAGEARVTRVTADRPEQDDLVLRERHEVVVGEDLADCEKVPCPEGVGGDVDRGVIRHCRSEDLDGLGHHLGPDPVAGDGCEVDVSGHTFTVAEATQTAFRAGGRDCD